MFQARQPTRSNAQPKPFSPVRLRALFSPNVASLRTNIAFGAFEDDVEHDIADTTAWHPRGIEIRGRGEAIALPTVLIRIHPERIVSWGLEVRDSARDVSR